MSKNINLYELLNSSIQSSQKSEINFSNLYELLRAILDRLETRIQGGQESDLEELQPPDQVDPASPLKPSLTPAGPGSSLQSGKYPQEASDVEPVTKSISAPSGPQQPQTGQIPAGPTMSPNASSSESHQETTVSMRNFSRLEERFDKLEALVESLKEEKEDPLLKLLRELINRRVDSSRNQTDQLTPQGALTDPQMTEREELDALEELLMNPASTEAASGSVDPDGGACHELRQQICSVRRSVQSLGDDMKQMKAQQASIEERMADQQLQDQERRNSGLRDPSTPIRSSHTPAAPGPVSGPTLKDVADAQPASKAPSGPQQQRRPKTGQKSAGPTMSPNTRSSESYQEDLNRLTERMADQQLQDQERRNSGLRDPSTPTRSSHTPAAPGPVSGPTLKDVTDLSRLTGRLNKLEALVASLREEKVDRSQLKHLRELVKKREHSASVDAPVNLPEQLEQQEALIEQLMSDRDRDAELVNDLQRALLQLQAEFESLLETTSCLQEDSIQKQSYIEELYKTTEELEENKADKNVLESVTNIDQSTLDSKVSHMQFDSVIEALNGLFQELLNKVTGQEQDWHKVICRLSSEMDCKLNRMEFDPVKTQLEERWEGINKKLQDQEAPECDDAAALRRQLVSRLNCLSCDRPVVHNSLEPNSEVMFSPCLFDKSFPRRAFKPQDKFPHHNRSKYSFKLRDCRYPAVSRGCGGKSTIVTRPVLFSDLKEMRDKRRRVWRNLPHPISQDTEESSSSLNVESAKT
ncbi:uncharacterized protein LOC117832974 [Notolabrus celidotus]|uniref:uncharacterized protein LOC117832974 n=1 Tax=Notolabrus celidotus TaxID=1203425 RepID=UPI00148F7798|nr:uncharacterized protein LOC117832974 [Notolabrus celidotus]